MAYIVLQRHSITNPSNKFAIVGYDEWIAFVYNKAPALPVLEYTDTAQEATDRVKALNDNDNDNDKED